MAETKFHMVIVRFAVGPEYVAGVFASRPLALEYAERIAWRWAEVKTEAHVMWTPQVPTTRV